MESERAQSAFLRSLDKGLEESKSLEEQHSFRHSFCSDRENYEDSKRLPPDFIDIYPCIKR